MPQLPNSLGIGSPKRNTGKQTHDDNNDEAVSTPKSSEGKDFSLPAISIAKPSSSSYQFGTANSIQFANVTLTNSEIIQRARESLIEQQALGDVNNLQDRNSYQRDLDWKVWQFISNWRSNHFIFHPSRCLACLIVNYTPNQVQIINLQLKEGENIVVIGVGTSFEPDSRTLLPFGGAAVVFIYGYTPSLTDLAHVKVSELIVCGITNQLIIFV
jgi:hypothetical protein